MDYKKTSILALLPVLLSFFVMGFVDLVGTASNYVKDDLQLSDTLANALPSLVFFWFLIFSIPTSLLMNKIGKKNTVLLSLIVTVVSLLIPVLCHGIYGIDNKDTSIAIMLVSFSLLGIGNTLMQTSLNPLMGLLVAPEKMASNLNLGQFIKAFASLIAPAIMTWGATLVIPQFGLNWMILFPVFMVVGIVATLWLYGTEIQETNIVSDKGRISVGQQFVNCFKLLGKPFVLICFLGIVCHVGIDVGTNTVAPKILSQSLNLSIKAPEVALAASIYFIGRTVGSFSGAAALQKFSVKMFFLLCVILMFLGMACMIVGLEISMDASTATVVLYAGCALVGFGNANVFPICLSQALISEPKQQNEVSGLMIMGLFGGTLFPLAMGVASDAVGQVGAVAVMIVGVAYLSIYYFNIKK